MSFNANLSIIAFTFGSLMSLILLIKKEFFYALFSFSIVIIQLLEYYAHISISKENVVMNKKSSEYLFILILLQPIIYSIALIFFPPNNITFEFKNRLFYFIILLIFYIIIGILYFNYNKNNDKFKIEYVDDCKNICRLNWNISYSNIKYSILLVLLYFLIFINFNFKTKDNLYLLNNFTQLILVSSILYIIFIDKIKDIKIIYHTFPNLWFFLAIFYGLIVLLFKNK